MQETNTKSLKKQLAAAIAMLLVAVVALGSASYAWFVTNNKVDATTTNISAQSNAAFMTIHTGATGASGVDTTSVSTTLGPDTKKLYPATFGEETGSTKGKFMTGYGTDLDNGALKGDLKLVGTAGTPDEANTNTYALKEQFNISSKGQNLSDLMVESVVTKKDAAAEQELKTALRVLVTNSDASAWVVYGLKSGTTDYEIKLSSDSGNANVALGDVTAGSDTVVNVYMYYEGSVGNIKTRNLQDGKLDASQSVTINFTATPKNK